MFILWKYLEGALTWQDGQKIFWMQNWNSLSTGLRKKSGKAMGRSRRTNQWLCSGPTCRGTAPRHADAQDNHAVLRMGTGENGRDYVDNIIRDTKE